MELESPASPPPVVEAEKPVEVKQKQEKKLPVDDSIGDELKDYAKRDNLSALLSEKYKHAAKLYEAFNTLASMGDLNAIYRNRQVFITQKRSSLVKPALDVFRELPSSRPAVYYYVGLVLHEYTHHSFNKIENPSHPVNPAQIRDTINKFLDVFQKYATETENRKGLADMLTWICNFTAELSGNNGGRPSMTQNQQPEAMLSFFSKWDLISKLIELMDSIITSLLDKSPDICMKVLFDASRHGVHFNWIWLHIALSFPGSIITHLLSTGVEQFRLYIEDSKKHTNPAILNGMHTEYQVKFVAVSDVFNFLMRKRSPELHEAVRRMLIESLNSDIDKETRLATNMSFLFFLKLTVCSVETLRILITNNNDLITPWNVIRGFRQVASVDAAAILATSGLTYAEFSKQVVEVIDPITHGIVFETMNALVYDKKVFNGENNPSTTEEHKTIITSCAPILETMVDRVIRLTHCSTGLLCSSQHPSISAFASDDRLQFLIVSIANHIDKSSVIIRHLHAISIANGVAKASEIVLRFLLTVNHDTPRFLYILTAFISATIKFFPNMMEHLYKEFYAFKILVELSDVEEVDKFQRHTNLLNNLRILFDWDASAEDSNPNAFLGFYPASSIGNVLNIVFDESLQLINGAIEQKDTKRALFMIRLSNRLLDSVCSVNAKKASRKLCLTISSWHKLMAQLALLLKLALLTVGHSNDSGISVFEALRTSIMMFLYNGHIDETMKKFVPIFANLFIHTCLTDSKRLFGETIVDNNLIDERGMNKLFDLSQIEEGPSVIAGISNIKMRDSALDMMHSGQLKKRRMLDCPGSVDRIMSKEDEIRCEDEYQRIYVVLDAFRSMCITGAREIHLHNSKQIAQVLTETICKDTLSADMKFDDWDLETEFVHRHVETDRRVAQSAFCDGLLRMLAETRSFAFCLPILKAQLAVIISDAEKSADRAKMSERVQVKLHRWMLLASKSGIIPYRFVYLCDLQYLTDAHETYLIMLEIWRFLQGRNLSVVNVENYHKELLKGEVDEGLPHEKEGMDRANFDTIRLILQNHISEAFHLFPKLFANEYAALKISTIE